MAASRVRRFVEEYRARWLYVMYSGGKDSLAALYTTLEALKDTDVPVVATFGVVPGLTHGDNISFVVRSWKTLCPGCPVRTINHRRPGDTRWRIGEPRESTLYIIIGWGRYGSFWDNVRVYGIPGPSERTGSGLRWCEPEHKGRWQSELPFNCTYRGRPARCLVVGVRRSESWYRSNRWPPDTPVTVYEDRHGTDVAISPIYDMSSADTWSIVARTGLDKELRKLYEKWGNNPNCVLCPLRSDRLNQRAISILPTSYLKYIRGAIESSMQRFKPNTFVRQKSEKWLKMIDEELRRRGEG